MTTMKEAAGEEDLATEFIESSKQHFEEKLAKLKKKYAEARLAPGDGDDWFAQECITISNLFHEKWVLSANLVFLDGLVSEWATNCKAYNTISEEVAGIFARIEERIQCEKKKKAGNSQQ
eukprot:Phypoly_transcript_16478.p2 GENE.Phypoly_transcript_16478~~Phypoly_transcript_16478.p2  ORF type:complete len:140 (-),score=33.85 Phypoly_transcript_16478:442-801(-)